VGLEAAALDADLRGKALSLLESLLSKRGSIVIACEVSPQRRLCSPFEFPGNDHISLPTAAEAARWVAVFARLRDISIRVRDNSNICMTPSGEVDSELVAKIFREARLFWPHLRSERERWIQMAIDAGESGLQSRRLMGVDIEREALSKAEPLLHRMWIYCTREERLMLYHLAAGRVPNPSNHLVLDSLISRRLVVMEPYPRLATGALQRFVLSAEPPDRFEHWSADAASGLWHTIRVPLFILIFLAAMWVVYVAGESFEVMTAILAGALTLLAQLFRAASYMRGRSPET
jgi:hypothetical protein